jgi:YggT family protein
MIGILRFLLIAYLIILIGRAILSWFPLSPSSPLRPLNDFCIAVTEPVLAPMRRVIPPAGMFDLSFLVLWFVIIILLQVLH